MDHDPPRLTPWDWAVAFVKALAICVVLMAIWGVLIFGFVSLWDWLGFSAT